MDSKQKEFPVWLLCLLLGAMAALAYQPLWHADFIWDDDEFVTQNPVVKSMGGLSQIWFTTATLDYYPMAYSLFWLEWHIWGNHPLGYHLINLLLHIASAVLLWRGLARLKIPGAFLAAAIFVLHPVNVESVAWIAEGKNTLCMFFYAASILFYLTFEDTRRALWYGFALTAFVLALFSKSAIAPLPLVLLGMAWWRRGRVTRLDLWRSLPFFLAAAAVCCVTVWFHYHRAMGGEVVRSDSLCSRLAGAGRAVWFYFYKTVLPLNLAFVYPRWQIDAQNALSYVPLFLLIAAFVALWRWCKAGFFALSYFVLMLLPILGFLNIYFMRYSLVADHWQYFAMIGPAALAGGWIRKPPIAALLLLTLGILTWRQCGIYTDAEKLWRATLVHNPGSVIARNNLSSALLIDNKPDEAVQLCRSVLAEHPNDATAQFNLGHGLLEAGRADEAMVCFQKILAATPASAPAAYHLGLAYLQESQYASASQYFKKTLQLQPDSAEAACNLGYALLQLGERGEAAAAYGRALELNPHYALAHNDLGNILLQAGHPSEAMKHFQQAAENRPDFAEAHFNMAGILLSRGKLDEAASQYETSLKLRPSLAEAHEKLGAIFAQQGRAADAVSQYESALRLRPKLAGACNGLAWLLATSPDGRWRNGPRAVELARAAVQLSQGKNPLVLATLAAAQAETRHFNEAVNTIDQALILSARNPPLIAVLEKQKAFYQAGSPFHETRRP